MDKTYVNTGMLIAFTVIFYCAASYAFDGQPIAIASTVIISIFAYVLGPLGAIVGWTLDWAIMQNQPHWWIISVSLASLYVCIASAGFSKFIIGFLPRAVPKDVMTATKKELSDLQDIPAL